MFPFRKNLFIIFEKIFLLPNLINLRIKRNYILIENDELKLLKVFASYFSSINPKLENLMLS